MKKKNFKKDPIIIPNQPFSLFERRTKQDEEVRKNLNNQKRLAHGKK